MRIMKYIAASTLLGLGASSIPACSEEVKTGACNVAADCPGARPTR